MLARIAAFLALSLAPVTAQAETLCAAFADAATGKVIRQDGKGCADRVTPASTFKIAIALMGYDSGILIDATHPSWPFKPGYAAWREQWKTDTDPTYWMKESVVWYSQQITTTLGKDRFRRYVDSFDYGNRDLSGDKGKNDGLTQAWLSSSLAIAPLEQLSFLGRMLNGQLPVSAHAVAMTGAITLVGTTANGWQVHGKTGMGFARDKSDRPVRDRPYGWFVGWATKGTRTIVFARLDRDATRQDTPTSWRARDAMLAALPAVLDTLN
ncbi:class D beta-lactamase [Ancylobacter amanitiformis]|uniref:Beta-lactamase n=1 Tax=Ancylobacter amanitiformis TaxID=217069 RepID=A0ABU0LLH1_9HYPH|nr:class D beta-lactamase [Ancylobacter amanitiformis]MDQ0509523.1 beta-lactamase class D [Ancylobacter amanitiformis]